MVVEFDEELPVLVALAVVVADSVVSLSLSEDDVDVAVSSAWSSVGVAPVVALSAAVVVSEFESESKRCQHIVR